MKPVAWQYKCKESGQWMEPESQDEGLRNMFEDTKHETRDLYAIPEGYVLVPVEPTEEMIYDGADAMAGNGARSAEYLLKQDAEYAYKAMIETAQEELE